MVGVKLVPGQPAFEITFDPNRLTEQDLRQIASEHPLSLSLQKLTLRLGGEACEACAIRLERRIRKLPGIRRATATYLGKLVCLTFDKQVTTEDAVLHNLRSTGASVGPYESPRPTESLWSRVRSGGFNDELSCGLGLVFLLASFASEHSLGKASIGTWLLYAGAYFFCGQKGVRSAIASLREKVLDVDVLMVLAAIGAGIVGQPFEGALLLFLFSFSNVLQSYALARTQKAIHSLLKLRPDSALRKRNGTTESVRVEALEIDDIVVVRPGEYVPVDGIVTEGTSHVDEASLTGESMPVSKSPGSPLFAGTLNQSGAMDLRVTKRAADSTLARMVKLVEEAQAEKSKTQRFLEEAEQYYATGVILFTLAVLLIPLLLWNEEFSSAFYRAMTVMVVASPCALVISTPATVLSAIGGAARRGILIKGGSHLETAARIDLVAFDKTGTLTVGRPSVTHIITPDGTHPAGPDLPASLKNLLALAAALESRSEHPLASAIVQSAKAAAVSIPAATGFQSTSGKGAEATTDNRHLVIGSRRFVVELGATIPATIEAAASALSAEGKTCVWLGEKSAHQLEILAVLALADTIRPEARSLSQRLHQLGVRTVVMLTGDQSPVAAAIAAQAGVDEVRAELLPEQKVDAIRSLKKNGRVMMVGDGVNDAPALATAHLGVAMGAAGTDVAMETADVVLMGDKLENIPHLLGMARHARTVLIQNLVFASAVIIVLLIAALGINLPLPLGVVGHEGSTVLVCLNGLRLLFYKP